MLTGCDKFNDIVGRIKEKSPWVYSEETDKINNTKLFVAKKTFQNKEGTTQVDAEFQCNSIKALTLQVKSFETKQVDGKYAGSTLNFSEGTTKITEGFAYAKTRNGDIKVAFPIISDEKFNNSAQISLTGFKLDGLQGITLKIAAGELAAELAGSGFKIAVDGKEIPKFLKTKDWVVEIPTQSGIVVAEIDLSNQYIQKVFEACSWKPAFLESAAPVAVSQVSAMSQSADSKSEPMNAKASSTINDGNIVAFVTANLTSEYVAINQPLSLAIRGNLMTADGDFKFLHSYTKTQLPNKLQNIFILCMSSTGIDKLANEATARVLADKFMVTGVSPNGDEFRISADKCEITNPV